MSCNICISQNNQRFSNFLIRLCGCTGCQNRAFTFHISFGIIQHGMTSTFVYIFLKCMFACLSWGFTVQSTHYDHLKQSINSPLSCWTRYTLSLQTVQIQISWLLKKSTDLDLHCLSFSVWMYINNLVQVIWLGENWEWGWHLHSAWQGLIYSHCSSAGLVL